MSQKTDSGREHTTAALDRSAREWLERHPRVAHELHQAADAAANDSPPGFQTGDLALSKSEFRTALENALVEKVGREPREGHRWQVPERARAAVRQLSRRYQGGPWPDCPHRGFRNLGDGRYTCQHPDCDRTYPETVAREVLYG